MVSVNMRLDHIQILSPKPAELAAFYAKTTHGQVREFTGGHWLCEGPARQLLVAEGPPNAQGFSAFVVETQAELDVLRGRCDILPSTSPLWGGRDAFAVEDPDGNRLEFALDGGQPSVSDPWGRLQHLAVRSPNIDALVEFYSSAIGLKVSDRVEDDQGRTTTCFLQSDHEHHSLAIFGASEKRLDHHSYEQADWNAIRDWADHLASLDIQLNWGPGRHGPGNNLFLFYSDPDGNWIEISAELEVPGDRPLGVWRHCERTLNLWGRAILRQ